MLNLRLKNKNRRFLGVEAAVNIEGDFSKAMLLALRSGTNA